MYFSFVLQNTLLLGIVTTSFALLATSIAFRDLVLNWFQFKIATLDLVVVK